MEQIKNLLDVQIEGIIILACLSDILSLKKIEAIFGVSHADTVLRHSGVIVTIRKEQSLYFSNNIRGTERNDYAFDLAYIQ